MSEERLIEITSTICKSGGHIWPMVHLTNMEQKERELFLQYVKEYINNTEHPNMALIYAIVEFSYQYLESKNIDVCKLIKSAEEEEREVVTYFESALKSTEELSKKMTTKRK